MQEYIKNIPVAFLRSLLENLVITAFEYPQASGLLLVLTYLLLNIKHLADTTTPNPIIYVTDFDSDDDHQSDFSNIFGTAYEASPQVLNYINPLNHLSNLYTNIQPAVFLSENTIQTLQSAQQNLQRGLSVINPFNYCPSIHTCIRNVTLLNNQAYLYFQYSENFLMNTFLHVSKSLLVASMPIVDTVFLICFPFQYPVNNTFSQSLIYYLQIFLTSEQIKDLSENDTHVLNIHLDSELFNKFNTLVHNLIKKNSAIPYLTKLQIARVIRSNNAHNWHWLHCQNLFSELKRIGTQDTEIDVYRLFHISFKWLETLYLDRHLQPSAYRYDDAKNMAGILQSLIESSQVYIAEETPQTNALEFEDTSNGLTLTTGLTDLISKLIIKDHQPLNLEVLLKRTSDDVNISMKLVEAYIENHDQTIKHLIHQIIYFILIYTILVTCIGICLLASVTNPLVSITIVSSLIAIPMLTAIYSLLAPNPLSKKQLHNSEKELIDYAKERNISEYDRSYELDSLLNNIGSNIIFYENIVTKVLYGLIFSTLLTTLIAIPMIFFGIHMLPIVAGIVTACFIGVGLFAFMNKMPVFSNEPKIKLIHNKIDHIIDTPIDNEINHLSLEHISNMGIISLILFTASLFKSDNVMQNNYLKMPWVRNLVSNYLLPIHPLIGHAILESLPLWDLLDKGEANAETHAQLKAIAEKVSNELPRNSLFNKSVGNIIDHIVELHSLDTPPSNLTDFLRTVLRLSLPYLPRLIAGTDNLKMSIQNCLQLAYPELDASVVETFSQGIQNFLISPSTDQTVWFNAFAKGILELNESIKNHQAHEDANLTYRKQWEENIVLAAERILGHKPSTHTVKEDPILNIIQSILEISQDALYHKGQLTKVENQTRDFLIRYSIMIEDIKYTEAMQYQFSAHYQYCWKQIPKIYFPTIIVLSVLLFSLTPINFSLPIIGVLLIGGLFLLPWLTSHSHEITRVNENSFDNLIEVAEQADKDIEKDAFLSPLLSDSFKSVSKIFSTARLSLRQMTTVTVIMGLIIIGVLAVTMSHIGPLMLGAMAATLLCAIIFNVLHEKYFSLPEFRNYQYYSPGVANDKYTSQFFAKKIPEASMAQEKYQPQPTNTSDNLDDCSRVFQA